MRGKCKKRIADAALKAGAAAMWIAVWQIISAAVAQELLVPSPVSVFKRLVSLAAQGEFWIEAASSLGRVLLGFAAAIAAGCLLSSVMHLSSVIRAVFRPLLTIIKATPVPSFIILALVWIKSDAMPVFIAFLMVLPIVCSNVSEGLEQVDGRLLEMARIYRISGAGKVKAVYLPSLAPYLMAAGRTGLGLAWKAGIAAEVIGRTASSIGERLYQSKLYLETADLFAYTAVVIILSRLLETTLISAAEKVRIRMVREREEDKDDCQA